MSSINVRIGTTARQWFQSLPQLNYKLSSRLSAALAKSNSKSIPHVPRAESPQTKNTNLIHHLKNSAATNSDRKIFFSNRNIALGNVSIQKSLRHVFSISNRSSCSNPLNLIFFSRNLKTQNSTLSLFLTSNQSLFHGFKFSSLITKAFHNLPASATRTGLAIALALSISRTNVIYAAPDVSVDDLIPDDSWINGGSTRATDPTEMNSSLKRLKSNLNTRDEDFIPTKVIVLGLTPSGNLNLLKKKNDLLCRGFTAIKQHLDCAQNCIQDLLISNDDLNVQLDSLQNAHSATLRLHASRVQDLETQMDSLHAELNCICCLERRREIVYAGCGHCCLCVDCDVKLCWKSGNDAVCPICRESIEQRIRMFT